MGDVPSHNPNTHKHHAKTIITVLFKQAILQPPNIIHGGHHLGKMPETCSKDSIFYKISLEIPHFKLSEWLLLKGFTTFMKKQPL